MGDTHDSIQNRAVGPLAFALLIALKAQVMQTFWVRKLREMPLSTA